MRKPVSRFGCARRCPDTGKSVDNSAKGSAGTGRHWHCLPSEQVPVSIRLAALVGATKIATDVSAFSDAEIWADQAVALAMDTGIPQEQQVALTVRGGLATEQARYADAALDLERALTLADERTDQAEFAETLIALSYVLLFTGDPNAPRYSPSRASRSLRERGDVRALGKALRLLPGNTHIPVTTSGRRQLGLESLRLFRGIEDTGGTAAALRQLGATAALRGDLQLAVSRYEEALAIVSEPRRRASDLPIAAHLAGPAMESGDLVRARELAPVRSPAPGGLATVGRSAWDSPCSATSSWPTAVSTGPTASSRKAPR